MPELGDVIGGGLLEAVLGAPPALSDADVDRIAARVVELLVARLAGAAAALAITFPAPSSTPPTPKEDPT